MRVRDSARFPGLPLTAISVSLVVENSSAYPATTGVESAQQRTDLARYVRKVNSELADIEIENKERKSQALKDG